MNFHDLRTCPIGHPSDPMDHWIPIVPLEEMSNKEYDVLIIGSGAGGGAALWRHVKSLQQRESGSA